MTDKTNDPVASPATITPEFIRKFWQRFRAANDGHVVAYGADPYTDQAIKIFQETLWQARRSVFCFWWHGRECAGLEGRDATLQCCSLRGDGTHQC